MNENLVAETTQLKEERRVVQERLDKIDESKATVSENVYNRVKQDYTQKLASASQALLAKKGEVDRELAMLYEARSKLQTNVETQQHELEELEFRKSLGEFEEAAFNEQSTGVKEKLTKFETLFKAVNTNIERYEGLFNDLQNLVPTATPAAPPPPFEHTPPLGTMTPETAPSAPETTPVEMPINEALGETDYQLDATGGDYFDEHKMPETRVLSPEDLEADTLPGTKAVNTVPIDAPSLIILSDTDKGQIFRVTDGTTIGRSKTNGIPLTHAKVSRQHAKLTKTDNQWMIQDLQSSNGIYLNQTKVSESPLKHGDQIQIGDFVMEFQEHD